jgi:glycosyltransferase involved in cell wall biosynthesis
MSSEKPLALLLTPVLPLPGGSGRALRAWDWLQELTRDHRVQVLLATDDAVMPELPADYPAEALWWLALKPSPPACRAAGLLLPPLAACSRRFVRDWQHLPNDGLPADLARHLAGQHVARLVVFRLYLHDVAQSLARLTPNARCELDMDDLESRTRMSVAASLLRLGHYREALRGFCAALQYAVVERCVRGYASVYLSAPEDGPRLPQRLAERSLCRPNRLGAPIQIPPSTTEELNLLFVGTLDYPPNEEAVCDLLRMLPALQTLARPWRLSIVGRHASASLRARVQGTERVQLLDDVEDLRACYAAAHIVLVPLRAGGGTKLKTLEGFAYRRPLISTAHGVRGLGVRAGEHFLAAERPAQFAAAIIRLATDTELATRLTDAGCRHFQEHFRRP